MKRTLITIISAIMLIFLPGLTANAAGDADGIVNRAVTKFQSVPSLTVQFTVELRGGSAPGTMTVAGDRFKLDLGHTLTWYDGRTQWTYVTTDNEISITEPTVEELAQINPFAIISSIRGRFDASLVSSGAHTDVVKFTPRKSDGIKSLTVKFNRATAWPSEITIATDNGDTGRIRISSITPGAKLPVKTFSCDTKVYPKAEVVDLR